MPPPAQQSVIRRSAELVVALGVPERIAYRSRRQPETVALRADGRTWTYGSLRRRTAWVAAQLRSLNLQPEDRVAVCLPRSMELIATLLGVWEAGAAYVPLDPTHPKDRLQYVLSDVRARAVIVHGDTLSDMKLPAGVERVVFPASSHEVEPQPVRPTPPERLAYVIYTSGSTGKPKGVEVEHGALTNLLASMLKRPGLRSHERMLALTTAAFDIAAIEMFLPLIVGAPIEVAPPEIEKNPRALGELLAKAHIDVMQATPSAWRLLIASGWDGQASLRALSGGEALSSDLGRELFARVGELWNLYGPTEATVWCSAHRVVEQDFQRPTIPLGEAVENTKLFVLDESLQATTATGELYIGGAALARGYHDRPDVQSEKFVTLEGRSERAYRTGDLVRKTPDGQLLFRGRADEQVKLRGHRIELGEVETQMRALAFVEDAVAVVKELKLGPELVAYVVPGCDELDLATLRAELSRTLPAYMLPTRLVCLAKFPLTPNAKVDKNALPSVEEEGPDAPLDELDTKQVLLRIWAEVLGRSVNEQDSFFEIGGHSLAAMELLVRSEQALGRSFDPQIFLQASTVAEQVELLEQPIDRTRATVVTLREGARPPVFFCGAYDQARALLAKLPDDRPMHVIAPLGLDGVLGPEEVNLEKIVQLFTDEVELLTQGKRAHLCGFCRDAKLAAEIALELGRRGRPVGLLGFIDPIWDETERPSIRRRMGELGLRWTLHAAKRRLELRAEQSAVAGRRAWRALTGQRPDVRGRHRQLIEAVWALLDARVVPPVPGRVDLFLSRETQDLASQCFARGTQCVHVSDALHDQAFGAPYVDELAEALEMALEAADGRAEHLGLVRPSA